VNVIATSTGCNRGLYVCRGAGFRQPFELTVLQAEGLGCPENLMFPSRFRP
jgi:hypothetical protein